MAVFNNMVLVADIQAGGVLTSVTIGKNLKRIEISEGSFVNDMADGKVFKNVFFLNGNK